MSNRKNYRRGEERRTEHGPTWEGGPPCSGCNSTHVARARRKYQDALRRKHRSKVKQQLHEGEEYPEKKRKKWH